MPGLECVVMSSQYAAELLQATPRFYLAAVDLGVAWGRN